MARPDDRERFRRALDHVDAHPDGDLSLARLSRLALFSKFHFHRRFAGRFGVGVHEHVRRVRLRRAAYLLAFRGRRILDVALACGFESHEAFSRAFKKAVGQTPSEFRDRPRWESWRAADRPLNELRIAHMTREHHAGDVTVVDFPETRVAALEHRGDPARIGDSIRDFIAWRKQNRLPPRSSATFNVLYGDPATTPPADFRLDLCAATDGDVAENPFGVVARTIPGGRCAVLRHVGPDDTLGAALTYLVAAWLPSSGESRRDSPLFLRRVRFFPDVPEHEAVVDAYLPLR